MSARYLMDSGGQGQLQSLADCVVVTDSGGLLHSYVASTGCWPEAGSDRVQWILLTDGLCWTWAVCWQRAADSSTGQ